MHIPDVLTERVYVPLALVSAAGIAFASVRARRDLEELPGLLPLTGVMGAFIFAAQMVNFPVLPGVSGHLVGGVLAGILLGPYCATVAMAAVFILQALLLGDGGVIALGANIFNMGLIATFLGYGAYRAVRAAAGERFGLGAGAFVAAYLSVLLGALATYLEVAISQPHYAGRKFLGLIMGFHAVIGLFEGAITVGVLSYIRRVRPDLVAIEARGPSPRAAAAPPTPWPLVWQMIGAALVVGLVLVWFKSELPDGMEAAGEIAVPGGPLTAEPAEPGPGR